MKAMTLKKFIELYDFEGAVVLLEGKRNVLENDKIKLTELGKLLAGNTKHILFRSGNAGGAEYYFSKGITSSDSKRLQVITPYKGHRKNENIASETISLDDITLTHDSGIVYESKRNSKMEKLIDQFVAGDVNRNSIQAAYIIRDTAKVTGTEDIPPATFAIFYDDLSNPMQGGTGHTIQVCKNLNVPFINQQIWFDWLIKK